MSLVRIEPGRIWRLTLDDPATHNSLSTAMMDELRVGLEDAASDPEARVVVIAGEGKHFCAGANFDELQASVGGLHGEDFGSTLEAGLRTIEENPLPVLAVVQGAALGIGCALVVTCDLAVAATDATLGVPPAKLGLVLNYENVQRLVLAVGPKRSTEMLLLGRNLSGVEAADWGIVNEAVAPDQLAARGEELAEALASAAPLSLRASKRGVRAALQKLSVERETEGFRIADYDMMASAAFSSEDLKEGIRALREGRDPEFRGK
ncbi:MAG: enoyl-CoA hydratase/isomerase family protein [Actinomycetota bacterium]